eukprot:6198115-Pleurochrysis_carterae.AAC.1
MERMACPLYSTTMASLAMACVVKRPQLWIIERRTSTLCRSRCSSFTVGAPPRSSTPRDFISPSRRRRRSLSRTPSRTPSYAPSRAPSRALSRALLRALSRTRSRALSRPRSSASENGGGCRSLGSAPRFKKGRGGAFCSASGRANVGTNPSHCVAPGSCSMSCATDGMERPKKRRPSSCASIRLGR